MGKFSFQTVIPTFHEIYEFFRNNLGLGLGLELGLGLGYPIKILMYNIYKFINFTNVGITV